jgi:hypothetical protein
MHPGYMIPDRLPWRHRARPSATLHEIQVRPEGRTCSHDVTKCRRPRQGETGCRGLAHLRTTYKAAPPFVIFERWAPRTMASGDFSHCHLSFPGFVHQDRSTSALRVVAKTAPWPLLRFEHQSTLHRVAMHVA